MVICGIKLTHDGAIALIDGNRLVFCCESEKIKNNKRHFHFTLQIPEINSLLGHYGYSLASIDRLVLDGWGREWNLPAVEQKESSILLRIKGTGRIEFKLSSYGHLLTDEDVLEANDFVQEETGLKYRSYRHVSGHIFGAYSTSPFAEARASSYILVWDGGMPPQLFHYDPRSRRTRNFGSLFPVLGSIYTLFPYQYKPFSNHSLDISIAGKAMAYIAVGKSSPKIVGGLRQVLEDVIKEMSMLPSSPVRVAIITKSFITRAKAYSLHHNIDDADMLASFHYFMQELLVNGIGDQVRAYGIKEENLCFAGGCALNIKWNSALRDAGIFEHIWIPPFPNDSGSAIGTACCEMVKSGEADSLRWNVYSGSAIGGAQSLNGKWSTNSCTLQDLATLIHQTGEPVVFLDGRAELGPRALGNRSILASACDGNTKQLLNEVKSREYYRPVAPVCLEEDAPEIFDPGSPDPYMLFEHKVREAWRAKIPAVCHLDGTARLQTVNRQQNSQLYELLVYYKQLSGIPVLCNTSANHKGKGFFPDLTSALEWGKLNYIWSSGHLYSQITEAMSNELSRTTCAAAENFA